MWKILVKNRGRWERFGFDHTSVEGARASAFLMCSNYVFLIIPA